MNHSGQEGEILVKTQNRRLLNIGSFCERGPPGAPLGGGHPDTFPERPHSHPKTFPDPPREVSRGLEGCRACVEQHHRGPHAGANGWPFHQGLVFLTLSRALQKVSAHNLTRTGTLPSSTPVLTARHSPPPGAEDLVSGVEMGKENSSGKPAEDQAGAWSPGWVSPLKSARTMHCCWCRNLVHAQRVNADWTLLRRRRSFMEKEPYVNQQAGGRKQRLSVCTANKHNFMSIANNAPVLRGFERRGIRKNNFF